MAITLGLVEAVDDDGVYVSMPGSRGVLRGPYEVLQQVVVGERVLVISTDDGEQVVAGAVGEGQGVSVRTFGAVGDGVTDDTAAIQACVDAVAAAGGGTVYVPPGTYMIFAHDPDTVYADFLRDSGGIGLKDNITFILDPAATLQAIANEERNYNIVRIYNKTNVTVQGGAIVGDRVATDGRDGECGYGLFVMAGSNITIRDIRISDCWGDGINLQRIDGTGNEDDVPRDVVVHNVVCDNNRRQGMSVEGVVGMTITDSVFSNTNGVIEEGVFEGPCAGIDFEPYDVATPVENVLVQRCRFVDNQGCGIQLSKAPFSGVVITACHFESNDNFQGQLVTATPGGRGLCITNNTFMLGTSDSTVGINLGGDFGTVVTGNRFDDTALFVRPAIDAYWSRRVVIQGNVFVVSSGAADFDNGGGFIGLISALDCLVDANMIDALETQNTNACHGVHLDTCTRVTVSNNKIAGTSCGVNILTDTDSVDIRIAGNEMDNNGDRAVKITGDLDGFILADNVVAGATHENAGPAVEIVSGTVTGAQVAGNAFYEEPRISGAGADRATYATDTAVTWTLRDNTVVGIPLYDSGATAPSTGYFANVGALMCDTTSMRPTSPVEGTAYYDTTLNKHITFNGSVWKDGTDTTV